MSVSTFVQDHADDIGWALVLAFIALLAGIVLHRSLRERFGSTPRLANLLRRAHRALLVIFVIAILRLILIRAPLSDDDWNDFCAHALDLFFLAAVAWFLCEIISAVEDFLILHYVKGRDHSDVRVRKVDTQVRLVSHLAIVAVIVIILALMLMTFPEVRIIGQSLLASAGIASVVAGLAAKTSLSNLFAGVQIALSDSVRVGDIIQIGDQSGVVDEITLTYVVIDLWNEHRLTVPSEFFISNQFQNWTRKGSEISALFLVDVDWTVPLDGLEQAIRQAISATDLWDKRSFGFKVYAISNGLITVRLVISTSSSTNMFLLEAVVNRSIVDFITSQPHGEGIPRTRTEGVGVVPLEVHTITGATVAPPDPEAESLARTVWEAATGSKSDVPSGAEPVTDPTPTTTTATGVPPVMGSGVIPDPSDHAASIAEAEVARASAEPSDRTTAVDEPAGPQSGADAVESTTSSVEEAPGDAPATPDAPLADSPEATLPTES